MSFLNGIIEKGIFFMGQEARNMKQLWSRLWVLLPCLFTAAPTVFASAPGAIDPGDTAWVLISAALVFLMTPGLGFFYGGMVRNKMYWRRLCRVSSSSLWFLSNGSLSAMP